MTTVNSRHMLASKGCRKEGSSSALLTTGRQGHKEIDTLTVMMEAALTVVALPFD